MRWRKLGLVYGPDGSSEWARTHAIVPTPVRLNEDVIRVIVTFRDAEGLGRPGYVDVAANDPTKVLSVSQEPLLDVGEPGTFDENGLMVCSVIPVGDGCWHMYYVGFELGTKIRYRLLAGIAVSEDDGKTFERVKRTPILERSNSELYFRGGPWCILEDGLYRMWYVSGSAWVEIEGKAVPTYDLRYVESADGINWPSEGQVHVALSGNDEHGLGRPAVIRKPGGGYRMFYSIRKTSLAQYRLGYAESADGKTWERLDEQLNLDVSPGSFDSKAIMYATPFQVGSQLYLFYNGDEFGREGFGVAVLENE